MLRPENRQLLVELSKTQYGRALKEYLDEKKAEISNINTIPKDNIEVEVVGRRFALELIKTLFDFMEEKPGQNRPKGQYE
jgi:hypothetical protein